jgi:CelD/BcsL family acetyltransferase involved in cellulose biosynthesis
VHAIRQVAPWAAIANDWGDGWIVGLPPPVLARRERQVALDRRHAERQGVRVAVEVRRDSAAVAEALERLFDLHRRRWATRRDDMSRFSKSAGERAWHRQALGRMAEERRVIITEVREDGRLVASTLVLLAGQGALFHTTAMAPGGVLRSPGHSALLAALVAAREAGATVMHLGRGGGEHKLRWQPERDRLARIAAARSPGQQRLLGAALRVDSSLAALVHASVRRLHGLAARPR